MTCALRVITATIPLATHHSLCRVREVVAAEDFVLPIYDLHDRDHAGCGLDAALAHRAAALAVPKRPSVDFAVRFGVFHDEAVSLVAVDVPCVRWIEGELVVGFVHDVQQQPGAFGAVAMIPHVLPGHFQRHVLAVERAVARRVLV